MAEADAREMSMFLRDIIKQGGAAESIECPTATRAQDRIRKKAKALGWVVREGSLWKITEAGRSAYNASPVKI